jgi:D-amino-acid dehydrogenase
MTTAAADRVVVVGGGVIGAACAYYIRKSGRAVTLVEQGEFGRGCSHANCGFICPSHVLPAAAPGALWTTVKALFARQSALSVRWRFDPALWRWFWQFGRKCNRGDMLRAGHAIKALLDASRSLYDELLAGILTDVEWEPLGLLFVLRSQRGMEHFAQTDELLRREFGVGATRYGGQALLDLEPALKPGSAGGWHYMTDGQLRPDKLMRAWRRTLEGQGVEIREHCELLDMVADGRVARGLMTSRSEIPADQVVFATGAWTPRLQCLLRQPIAIQPGKGYSLTMPRPALCPRYPMIFEEHRVAVTPFASAYRIGSTMEFTGYDTTLNPDRLKLLCEGAAIYLREPLAEPILESWYGWRPMSPDGLPFVGRLPAFDNAWVAAGHGMLGVSMAPSTGRFLAELIAGEVPHLDPTPYSVGRRL